MLHCKKNKHGLIMIVFSFESNKDSSCVQSASGQKAIKMAEKPEDLLYNQVQ